MIRKSKKQGIVINIDGPSGNAHCLMGMARGYAKQLGFNPNEVIAEMMSGNYINLLKTFERYFGNVITLETDNEEYLKALGS